MDIISSYPVWTRHERFVESSEPPPIAEGGAVPTHTFLTYPLGVMRAGGAFVVHISCHEFSSRQGFHEVSRQGRKKQFAAHAPACSPVYGATCNSAAPDTTANDILLEVKRLNVWDIITELEVEPNVRRSRRRSDRRRRAGGRDPIPNTQYVFIACATNLILD